MPTLGYDCQVVLDGTGYFVEPGSYQMKPPNLPPPSRPVAPSLPTEPAKTGGVPVRILDRGPNQRIWTMNLLCLNTLKRADGTAMGPIGQQLRDALHHSYEQVATLLDFLDPNGYAYRVAFTDLTERVADLRTQLLGIDYVIGVVLTEAV